MGEVLSIAEYRKEQELSEFAELLEIFRLVSIHSERVNKQTPYNCVFVNKDGFVRYDKLMGFYERYRIPKISREPVFVSCESDDYSKVARVDCHEYEYDRKHSVEDFMIFREI